MCVWDYEAMFATNFLFWTLLDSEHPYELKSTGQGLHRVQKCARVHNAMLRILEKVQRQCGVWIGKVVLSS